MTKESFNNIFETNIHGEKENPFFDLPEDEAQKKKWKE